MPRQQSLFSFYKKGGSRTDPASDSAQRTTKAREELQEDGRCIDSIINRMRKPRPRVGAQQECPLVPGTKRVLDDWHCDPICMPSGHNKQTKRMKLLEALGADEDVAQGAWIQAQSKFEWLQPTNIRDGAGRRPCDPLFDKRTVHIPNEVLKKMSASQKQYWATKSQYMDVLLFFKVGKFYELYELDAEIGHKELDWKMTVSGVGKCRQVGVPESGIEDAIQKLVARGYKVGRMEQVETAEQAKARRGANAMVERQLTQVLTPSTPTDGVVKPDAVHLLAYKEEEKVVDTGVTYQCGFSFLDAAAGRCYVGSLTDDQAHSALESLLMQVAPQEFLYEIGGISKETLKIAQRFSPPGLLPMFLTPLPSGDFISAETTLNIIRERGYFRDERDVLNAATDNALGALGALLSHLHRIKMEPELPSAVIRSYDLYTSSLTLDGQTIANLELLENSANGSKTGTLIEYLDGCVTAFGKRLLRRWICHPLSDVKAISSRLNAVDALASNADILSNLREHFKKMPDVERLLARIRAFSGSFDALPLASTQIFKRMLKILCSAVKGMLGARRGLECLREVASTSSLLQASYQLLAEEAPYECLSSIQAQLDIEKFCLIKIVDGDEEATLSWLLAEFSNHGAYWGKVVDAAGTVDVLAAFASNVSASAGPTCRPEFDTSGGAVLHIQGLWHPFANKATTVNSSFVRNDISLGGCDASPPAMLLTGPNMGGKSTLLRATCLAALMAQIGCYVAAERCRLSCVDRIFTRIGARDRIMSAESTFMVECKEAASTLQHATPQSLVVMDELGRGTSTFDGYAVAYAVLRYLAERVGCRLMFATHYHPLTDDFARSSLVALQHMATSGGSGSELVFLYKLAPGACPRSYGFEVALLAGMPASVVERGRSAGQLLADSDLVRRVLAAAEERRPTQLLALWRGLGRKGSWHPH